MIGIFPENVFKSFVLLLYSCLGKPSKPISFIEMGAARLGPGKMEEQTACWGLARMTQCEPSLKVFLGAAADEGLAL